MNLLKMKSRGLKIVLIFNFLVAALIWWASSNVLKSTLENPIFTAFIDSVPTLTIKDNTIVNPVDLNTVRNLGNDPLLYIQTDRDNIGVGVIQDGIYITRKAVSVLINSNVVSQIELPEEGVISPEKIHQFFHQIIVWAPVLLALVYIGFLWIFYLALVGLTALVGLIIARFTKAIPQHSFWRCATISAVTVLLVDFAAGFMGYSLPVITYYGFPIPLLVQLLIAWPIAVGLVCVETFVGKKTEEREIKTKKKKEVK